MATCPITCWSVRPAAPTWIITASIQVTCRSRISTTTIRRPSSMSSMMPPPIAPTSTSRPARAVDNYALNSGNTAPRGAASTAAGDKSLGRRRQSQGVSSTTPAAACSAPGPPARWPRNATPEGIATNGTDVWIVDAKSDKVFKYTGAASRLSGSQNAASSFNLNSGNAEPQGHRHRRHVAVGRQRLARPTRCSSTRWPGALLGSWTISSGELEADRASRSIPANVSNIWIVDSGTDRVYQYNGRRQPHLRQPSRRRPPSPWPPATPTRKASPIRRRGEQCSTTLGRRQIIARLVPPQFPES